MTSQIFLIYASVFLLLSPSWGADAPPICYDNMHNEMPVNNAEVVRLEKSTPNQFLTRAHIQGILTKVYPNKNDHVHFQMNFDSFSIETIEVIYNLEFGSLPDLHPGMLVEACGDYITSNAATDRYPASPDGSIIHWVHGNPSGRGHPGGFLVLDGVTYGKD